MGWDKDIFNCQWPVAQNKQKSTNKTNQGKKRKRGMENHHPPGIFLFTDTTRDFSLENSFPVAFLVEMDVFLQTDKQNRRLDWQEIINYI